MVADPTSTGAGNPSSAAAGSGVVTKDEVCFPLTTFSSFEFGINYFHPFTTN